MNQENLWAPWRLAYVDELSRRMDGGGETVEPGSFLERYWRAPECDVAHHVIERDAHGMILLNRYPYANGHLLVALGEARPSLMAYEPEQRAALWSLVERAMRLMEDVLNPQGVNVGINQGAAAGAGVPEHLHAHLVPRWASDTNFISVVGHVRVIPGSLEDMAARYRDAIERQAR